MQLSKWYLYPLFVGLSCLAWLVVTIYFIHPWEVLQADWPISIMMIFGSFIGGASSEGGGAVAFPVMTLLYKIPPAEARIFSLGIQSFGMTAASLMIIGQGIPIVKRAIVPVLLGGIVGFIVGDLIVTDMFSPASMKLAFVSIWLSFGFALWIINREKARLRRQHLPKGNFAFLLLLFGLIGGVLSSAFGSGIDILIFTLLILYFRIDEKVGTPTSVVLMTCMTIFGFLWHLFIRQDVSTDVFHYLWSAVPIVIFFGPLGAYLITYLSGSRIAVLLCAIIVAQFIIALFVIKPGTNGILLSVSCVVIGLGLFLGMAKLHRPDPSQPEL